MTKTITAGFAAIALALPSMATAQETTEPAAPETETAEAEAADEDADANRKICKTQTITGSRLAKRKICRTAAEWKLHQEETRKHARQALDRHAAAADNQ